MLPASIQNLIILLSRWPGVSQRAATRLSLWLVNQSNEDLKKIAAAIGHLKTQINICSQCFNFSNNLDSHICSICADLKRDQDILCIIKDALDILPIERTGSYRGLYYILGNTLAPSNGIGPENLRIKELITLLKNKPRIQEIILAFNPDIEGDATALYLERILAPLNKKITRLGRGLSTGSDLEYTDETTLSNAFKNRG